MNEREEGKMEGRKARGGGEGKIGKIRRQRRARERGNSEGKKKRRKKN